MPAEIRPALPPFGKGRKERSTPLRKDCVEAFRAWLNERKGADGEPLFVSNRGGPLSRDAVERIVRKHVEAASKACPTLGGKRVTPHVLRHSAALLLLQNGVDRTVIALWLGHESVESTQIYVHADIELKEKAMAKTQLIAVSPGRYRPSDDLLAFLEGL
jgi:integrase/recombinase XerD